MAFNNGPKLVTQGLNLLVDAGDPTSYPGTGTTWRDVVGGQNGIITGSVSYSSAFYGGLVFSGPTASVIFPTSSANFGTGSFTVELAFQQSQSSGIQYLISKNSGSFPNWGVYISGSKLISEYNISSTIKTSTVSTSDITTGSAYICQLAYQPSIYSGISMYVNTLPQVTNFNLTGSLSNTGSFTLGSITGGLSPLNGTIYSLKVYNRGFTYVDCYNNFTALGTRLRLPKAILTLPNERYSGLVAGYSLRKLRSTYTGSAILIKSGSVSQIIGLVDVRLNPELFKIEPIFAT